MKETNRERNTDADISYLVHKTFAVLHRRRGNIFSSYFQLTAQPPFGTIIAIYNNWQESCRVLPSIPPSTNRRCCQISR